MNSVPTSGGPSHLAANAGICQASDGRFRQWRGRRILAGRPSMITSFLRKPDGSLLSPVDPEAVRQALASGEGLLWIDLEAASDAEASLLSEVFHFHHLAIEDCFNSHVDPAKIDDYGDYLFLIAQAITNPEQTARLETTELDLFLGRNYVVSFHSEPLPFVANLRRRCEKNGLELARGADFLAHALLDALVDDYQPLLGVLDG